MGPEVVLMAAVFCATGRPEIGAAIDAQYGIGHAVDRYARTVTPASLWQVGATVAPLAQMAITRRVTFEYRF